MYEFLNSPIYYNKSECRFRNGKTRNAIEFEKIWQEIVSERKANGIKLPVQDEKGTKYFYSITNSMEETMEKFEKLHDFLIQNTVLMKNSGIVMQELEKETILQESLSSAMIEGSTANITEIKKAIKSKKNSNEISVQMVLNNIKAHNLILKNLDKPLSKDFIIKLWNIIIINATDQEIKDYSNYRNGPGYVTNGVEVIYTAPSNENVESLMNEFIHFFNEMSDMPELIKAGALHFIFESIHPFFDGNGRLGRALTNMYLLQNGIDVVKYSDITSITLSKKNQYYKKLQESRNKEGDITYFITFHCELMIEMLANGLKVLQNIKDQALFSEIIKNYSLTDSQKKIILLALKYTGGISITQTAEEIDKTNEMARLELNKLIDIGILEKSNCKKNIIFKIRNI